jgi:hypothetical protein
VRSSSADRLDGQGAAYHNGYSCVMTVLKGFAKAHLTKNITTVAGARLLSERVVVSCDKGAVQDRVGKLVWFKMGAADAVRDLFGERSARVACLLATDCAATHSTIAYFIRIQQGQTP